MSVSGMTSLKIFIWLESLRTVPANHVRAIMGRTGRFSQPELRSQGHCNESVSWAFLQAFIMQS